jgi:hypothetical protein
MVMVVRALPWLVALLHCLALRARVQKQNHFVFAEPLSEIEGQEGKKSAV